MFRVYASGPRAAGQSVARLRSIPVFYGTDSAVSSRRVLSSGRRVDARAAARCANQSTVRGAVALPIEIDRLVEFASRSRAGECYSPPVNTDDGTATRLESRPGATTPAGSAPALDDGGYTPGTLLDRRYRIVALLGRGGMGEVYRAQDLKLGQSVALKFLPETVHHDPARLERFLAEVRIARQISHPNVCRVYDVGEIDGRHYLSMEYVDGEDLAALLRRIGRLPPDKGVEIARQLCAGLAAAHDRGVLHRDLKPANIMIDGRGHARLADFGLAAVGTDLRPGEIAGTPAYMAPEQLEGRELSTKSDIYSLGVVLHELFTGRRLFEFGSIAELRDQHRSGTGSRSTVAGSSVELDPAIDRVIRRCLEPDPQRRPATALAVAAALPGGDPLAAAIAAGETPSPELVAQAGSEGTLAPRVAWALLVLILLGVLATAWHGDRARLFRVLSDMRSPEVLAARAEDLLDALGYGGARADRVYGLRRNFGAIGYVNDHDRVTDRWERAAARDVPAVQFWYRQSPVPLVPYDDISRAGADDPPPLTPGMVHVELTSRGRLVSFAAVPPQRYDPPPDAPMDWTPLFRAAGVDPSVLTAATPMRAPPTYADRLFAWEGRYPGRPDWTMRIEAASYRARPVWFVVAGPWERTPGPESTAPAPRDVLAVAAPAIQAGFGIVALVGGAWLARRNLRAGRADRRGATIVAACTGVSLLLSILVGNHYAGNVLAVWNRVIVQAGLCLYWGVVIWLQYVALEPFVRRRWPEAMISWTRLLAGRFRDPLVARDVLVGCAGGLAILLVNDTILMLPEWLGRPPVSLQGTGSLMRSLGAIGPFAAEVLRRPSRILLESMLMLFFILLAQAALRNRWLATGAVIAAYAATNVDRAAVLQSTLSFVVLVGVLVTLVSRFGVVSYVAAWFVVLAMFDLPLALDASAWYAARSASTATLIVAVAGWAFYRSVGGRPVFGAALDV
jgi:serine/threonine-protein kinase